MVVPFHKPWSKIAPNRYTRAAEAYAAAGGFGSNRAYQRVKAMRAGGGNAVAVAARSLEKSQQMNDPQKTPDAPRPDEGGALAAIAKGMQTAIGWEQQLTAVFGNIPFPKMQALTVGDFSIGLPHAHMHPPNLIPPSTVPIPMPNAGPVMKIPVLSGADHTKHGGKPASLCGDMGPSLTPWCGGYVPMFEVFFGSANVWIEGSRAARVLCDVVRHCTFTTPKPSDPPLGPMVGVSAGGVNHVGIGGVPLPSFFSMALGKAFAAVASVGGKIFRKVTAKSFVDKLIKKGAIQFDNAYTALERAAMESDLIKIASTRTGRRNLKRVAKANKKKGFKLTFEPSPHKGPPPNSEAGSWNEHTGDYEDAGYMDPATGKARYGYNAKIRHSPLDWPAPGSKVPSDVWANHELNHAANNMEGRSIPERTHLPDGWGRDKVNPQMQGRWRNFEEFETTHVDNAYRRERGFKPRKDYRDPGF